MQKIAGGHLLGEVKQAGTITEARRQRRVLAESFRRRKPSCKAAHIQKILKAAKIPEAKHGEDAEPSLVNRLRTPNVALRHRDRRGGNCSGVDRWQGLAQSVLRTDHG